MSALQTLTVLAVAALVSALSYTTLSAFAATTDASPVGYWRTIDDKTGEAKAIVSITERNGELSGKVVRLLNREGEEPNPTCDECPGERKGRPVKGMTILWGLTKEGDEWSDGTILDPSTGDTYDATVEVTEEGRELDVRGYIGFSFIGRTQTWERTEAPKQALSGG